MRPSGSAAMACSMRRESLAISATKAWSVRASARTSSPLAWPSASPAPPGGAAQAFEQGLRGAAPAVAVLGEEGGQALGSEAHGRFGRRVALEEGERDRAGEIGEDAGGAGPEALQQGAELVGEGDVGGDEVVAAAHQGAQGFDGVGLGRERAQAMAVGAQDVGQDEGVAGVALGGDGAVAGSAGLDGIGMDRGDDEAGLDEGIDQEAGGPLDGDRDHARRAVLLQARHEHRQPGPVVADLEPVEHHALGVDHADGVGAGAPIDADPDPHRLVSSVWRMIPIAGSPGGMLIDRRSGRQPTAHLPVARRGLPAAAAPQLSRGPSKGEQHWRSRRRHGTSAPSTRPVKG